MCPALTLFAQETKEIVTGKVLDENNEPLVASPCHHRPANHT